MTTRKANETPFLGLPFGPNEHVNRALKKIDSYLALLSYNPVATFDSVAIGHINAFGGAGTINLDSPTLINNLITLVNAATFQDLITVAGLAALAGGLNVGSGTTVSKILKTSGTINFGASLGANLTISNGITLTGIASGDLVLATPNVGVPGTGVVWQALVVSSNSVEVELYNATTSSQSLTTRTWTVMGVKF